MSAYRKILVAVDGSSAATRGLREAVRLAKAQGAQLCILQVVNEFHAYAVMEGAGLGADLPGAIRELAEVGATVTMAPTPGHKGRDSTTLCCR